MIRIAIVEDDKASAMLMQDFVFRFGTENNCELDIKKFSNGMDFISDYRAEFDIVLMDIDMPFMNGIEASKKMRQLDENICLIFTTNLAHYAVNGYEVDALAFLVKPIKYFDLMLAMKKCIRVINRNKDNLLILSYGEGKICLSTNDILYIEVLNHRLICHTTTKNIDVFGSLNSLENKLLPLGFIKPHRCYLVNPKYITEIKQNSLCVGKDELLMSRHKKKEIINNLINYMGGT